MNESRTPQEPGEKSSGVHRRTIIKGAAWSVPVVAAMSVAPLAAASTADKWQIYVRGDTSGDRVINNSTDQITFQVGLDPDVNPNNLPWDGTPSITITLDSSYYTGEFTITNFTPASNAKGSYSYTGTANFTLGNAGSSRGITIAAKVPTDLKTVPAGTVTVSVVGVNAGNASTSI